MPVYGIKKTYQNTRDKVDQKINALREQQKRLIEAAGLASLEGRQVRELDRQVYEVNKGKLELLTEIRQSLINDAETSYTSAQW